MSPKVSVVMPVHNGGLHLDAAVDSILSQSHTNLELILIDDHSTDAAIESLNQSDQRLKVIQSVGRGIVNACNTGFSHCDGDFIARMDGDDLSLSQRFEKQIQYLADNPDVDIAGCCVEIFSEHGVQGGLKRYQDWLNSVRQPADVQRQIFIESPLPNPSVMFRSAALQRLGGYRDVEWAEDYDMFLRADAMGLRMGKPEPVLLHWREHENRLTHTDARYARDQFMRARIHFLVRYRLCGKPVIIWGAGPTGRQIHDLLVGEGGVVEGFIEVHPRRIGGSKRGLPVWPVEKCEEPGLAMILIAVGAAGARQEISAFMRQHDRVEGEDYLFVA